MRVAIVDDHQLFRKSLAHLVNTFQDVDVVQQAENGKDFFENLKKNTVDLVLLDIQMPEMDGFETCKRLKALYPEVYILIISQLTTKESVHKVMEIGAHGFFTKNSNPIQLEEAINGIKNNGYYFGNELGSVLREALLWEKSTNLNTQFMSDSAALTSREIEIIKYVARGLSSNEIAGFLNINTRTVETHRKHLMEKTNSKNIIGVIIYALKCNLISLHEL